MMDPANLEHILDRLSMPEWCSWQPWAHSFHSRGSGRRLQIQPAGNTGCGRDIWETQTAYTFNLGQEDVVMVISNPGSSKRLQTLAEGAKENRCAVILITNNGNSPLARICDYKIVTATREKLLTEEF